jgi:integrase
MTRTLDDITLVPEPTANRLDATERTRYQQYRKRLRDWLDTMGKNPDRAEGYALSTVKTRMARVDKFMRWTWMNATDGFTLQVTAAHADTYMEALAQKDYARSYKADLQKAVKCLLRFEDIDWNPDITYSDPSRPSVAKSVLTTEEWDAVREAAANYGARIDYHNVEPEERAAMNAVLAERIGKPESAVGPDDWTDAPSFKFASMFWLGMDLGLRPAEIGKVQVDWLDLENCTLHIPASAAVKNDENWDVPFLQDTADYLRLWLEERECFEKYDDRDRVWLTKYGNPYASHSVNYHWRKLREAAGIDLNGRYLPYYSLRHTAGTNMGEEIGEAGAAGQLRQLDKRSARKYTHARKEKQREALNKRR